jgi:hypothetical protein
MGRCVSMCDCTIITDPRQVFDFSRPLLPESPERTTDFKKVIGKVWVPKAYTVDSLDNVVAFSSTKRAMCPLSDEGLVTRNDDGKAVDRRIKIFYDNRKFHKSSYFSLCQVTSKLRDGSKAVGSGFYINSRGVYITSAHNVMAFSIRTKLPIIFGDWRIYSARQGEDNYVDCSFVNNDKVSIHHEFNGQSIFGFDISKLLVTNKFNPRKTRYTQSLAMDVTFAEPRLNDIKSGMTVEVAGYPGKGRGYPFTHIGKVVDITSTALGGCLLWYDVDTTPGNSGSCVMITDMNYVRTCTSDPGIRKVIVGVHSGHDEVKQLNYGTLITTSLYKWILKQ